MQPLILNLDTKVNNYDNLDLMQGYDYTLQCNMFDNWVQIDLTNVNIQVQLQKADKTFIIQTENITVNKNEITIEIDRDFTREDGKGKIQIVLEKNGKRFGSWVIDAKIKPSAINDNDGQSGNKITITEALNGKIVEAQETKKELDISINNGNVAKIRSDLDDVMNVDIPKINSSLETIVPQIDGFVSVKLYEHLVVNNDWANAIKTALKEHKNILLPQGVYYVSEPIHLDSFKTLKGVGRELTKIIANFYGGPVVRMCGKYVKLSSLSISRTGALTNNSLDSGIECGNGGDFLGQSLIEEIEITNQHKGIYASPQTNVYSCTFKDLWINRYSSSGIYLEPYGSTGCVFDNIYTTNWDSWTDRTKVKAQFGMFLKGYSECNIRQLNIEHTNLAYALYLNTCDTVNIETLHIEGYEQRGQYNGIIGVDTSTLNIGVVTVVFSSPEVDRSTLTCADIDWNVFKINNGSVYCDTVFNRNNYELMGVNGTIIKQGSTALAYNVSTSDYKDNVNLKIDKRINKDNIFNAIQQFTAKSNGKTHQVINIENNVYYENKSGRIYNYFTKAKPTLGEWVKGDRVIGVNTNYADLLCVLGGVIPSKELPITGTGTQWNSGLTLTSSVGLKVGYGITIEGHSQVYEIIELWGDGCNVKPVLQVTGITNKKISIAEPTFKGIGLIES